MKKAIKFTFLGIAMLTVSTMISCGDDSEQKCAGCPDDAPYGAVGGGCYSTLSDCNDNESGNCVICQ